MTLNRREAEKGSGDWSPGGVWGGNPIVPPNAKRKSQHESGSEAIPDSANAASTRSITTPAKRIIR